MGLFQQAVKPNIPRIHEFLAESQFKLGELEYQAGRQDHSRIAYKESIRIFDKLLARAPQNRRYRANRGRAVMGLAMASRRAGKTSDAEGLENEAFAISDALLAKPVVASHDEEHVLWLASTAARIRARAAVERQDPKMLDYLQQSVDAHRRLAAALPDDAQAKIQTLSAELIAASVQVLTNDLPGAEKILREAKKLSPAAPGDPLALTRLRALVLTELARIYRKRDELPAAEAEYQAALPMLRTLSLASPEILTIQLELTRTQTEFARTLLLTGKKEAARKELENAQRTLQELLRREPANKDYADQLAEIEQLLGDSAKPS